MQEKIEERHKEITHIQNTIWAAYKDFLSDHDMAACNHKMQDLAREYVFKGDEQLLTFVQWLLITWSPIINGFAEEFRNSPD